MVHVYILINLAANTDNEAVVSQIRTIPEVKEAYRVYGTYDIIVHISIDDTSKVRNTILNAIRTIPSVVSTITMISLEHFSKDSE